MTPITTTDLRTIRNNLHLTDKELGQRLNRTKIAITNIRQKHRISKGRIKLTKELLEIMQANRDKSYRAISELVGGSVSFVKRTFKKQGLTKTKWVR